MLISLMNRSIFEYLLFFKIIIISENFNRNPSSIAI